MKWLRLLVSFFLEFLETAAVSLLIFAILYAFVFQPHKVKGSSMMPNFLNGEYLLTSKLAYRLNKPKRGEVVIFKAPNNIKYDYIKRIIGLPGERVKIKNNHFYINGSILDESNYLPQNFNTRQGMFLFEGKEIIIPANSYLMIGDNRENSSDSRDFGPVDYKNIVGKAWFRYWPPNKFGLIKHFGS